MDNKKLKYLAEQKQQQQRKAILAWANAHGQRAPVTRRDFLSAGAIPFAAALTLPTLGLLLRPSVALGQAQACPSASSTTRLAPFVTMNLAGGAMLAANYVPMDRGEQLLPTYNKLGLGNSGVPIVREFNNAPFAGAGISKFLVSLRANATVPTLAKTAFVAIPCRSQDDSDTNRFDISGMVSKAGLIGEDLPNLGQRDSVTGVRQEFAKIKPPNPLRVGNFSDIAGALGGGGTGALGSLNDSQKVSFFNLVRNLNESQVQRVINDSGGQMLAHLISCASQKNAELAAKPAPPIDVRQDTALAGVWGVDANTGGGEENVVFGSMILSALRGAAGTVALEKGGYDYHDNTRNTGDERDGEAGAVIGKILETAAIMGQRVFIYLTSDGSCSAPVSEDRAAPWTSDRGSAGVSFCFAFDPAGRPATKGFQIGGFTAAQAADDDFITGGNPEMAASAAFANYLQFNRRIDLLESVIPGTFDRAVLDQVLKIS